MNKYVIASSKDWFHLKNMNNELRDRLFFLDKKEDLTIKNLEKISPRFIFFPHWNWFISEDIFNNFECVVFHTAPLPYGRGGSPIQNLILNGHREAPVCSLMVNGTLDGGPIYIKETVSLEGSLTQIFERINLSINKQINQIIENEPKPKAQKGEVVTFKRRNNLDNKIPINSKLLDFYDRVRMLDHPEYPKSYIEHGTLRFEFENCFLEDNELVAKVKVKNAD